MENPGLPEALWSELDGRLWHATDRYGLRGIVERGRILANVDHGYVGSFCRHQGGVSLFDFGPVSEDVPNQFTNWCGWLGHQQKARVAVWLEIDRVAVRENLLDAGEARARWNDLVDQRVADGGRHEPGVTFIPGVEACHSGPIPMTALSGVLLVDQHDGHRRYLRLGKPGEGTIQEIDAFEATLAPHEDDPIVSRLLAGRRKAGD